MMNIDEKTKCFQDAFDIARKNRDLDEKSIAIFENVEKCLDKDIVSEIKTFTSYNKGIVLIGSDYDLISGAVAYIWYCHPFEPRKVPEDIKIKIQSGIKEFSLGMDRSWPLYMSELFGTPAKRLDPKIVKKKSKDKHEIRGFRHIDFMGHSKEDIKTTLFSEPEKLMTTCTYGGILFLRDIDVEHTHLLTRIARTVRKFKQHEYSIGTKVTIGDILYFTKGPGILVMNVKKTKGLPAEYLKQFQEIPLDREKERQDVIRSTEKDKGKKQRTPKGIIPVVVPGTKWSIDKKSKRVLYDRKYLIKLTDLEFEIFSCLHKCIGNYVKIGIIKSCWKSRKPKYKNYVSSAISKIKNKIKFDLNRHGVLLDNDIIEGDKRAPKRISKYKLLP